MKEAGFPVWGKSIIVQPSTSTQKNSTYSGVEVQIPFVLDTANKVSANLTAGISGSDTLFTFIRDWQYKNYSFSTDSAINAKEIMALFAYHEKNVLNHSKLRITDKRLLMGLDSLNIDTALNYVVEYTGTTQASGKLSTQVAPISPSCLLVSSYIQAGYTVEYFTSGSECFIVSIDDNYTLPPSGGGGGGGGGGSLPPWWQPPCSNTNPPDPPAKTSIIEPCPGTTGKNRYFLAF